MTQTQTSEHSEAEQQHKVSIQDPLEGYAFFEGRVVPIAEAKVSIATHALQYGTACFEGIRAYWNASQGQLYVLKMREHYERMAHSWNVMRIQLPYSIEDIERITVELLRKHRYQQDVYIRPIAYKASLTVKPRLTGLKDEFAIYTFGMGNYVDIESGLHVCTSSWRRANSNAMPVRAKVTGGYVNSALAAEDALSAGFDETIMLTHDGYVSEGSSCNLFMLRNGKLITPAPSEDILEGITRNTLIQLVRDEFGLSVEERRIDRTELYASEEVFLCGTGVQVSPVVSIDRRPVGSGQPGPFTMQLQALYLSACRGEQERYRHWLTPVYE